MSAAIFFIAFLVVQRLSELVLAKRNTQRLLERGAYEVGAGHYPLMVAVHGAFVVAIAAFGYDQPVNHFFLAVYVLLQVFRIWILTSLGERWTTRIIIIDEPLIARGPYRFIKHPNYVLVVGEIFVAPMVLGLFWVAIVFSILNLCLLAIRIPAENAALAKIRP
ncbi:MAG: isoprenylcysteine carboxylmethyltransferase family protein [Pseudomonadota bacterium]